MITAIRKIYSGIWHYGDPVILDQMIDDMRPMTRAPREMDWLKSEDAVRRRIFQLYKINPINVGEITSVNRAQAATASDQECRVTINPVLDKFSSAASTYVLPVIADIQRGDLVLWWEPCKAKDEELRTKRFEIAVKHDIVTKDEYRQLMLALPPLDEDDEEAVDSPLLSNPQAFNTAVRLLELVGNGTIQREDGQGILRLFLRLDDDALSEVFASPEQRMVAGLVKLKNGFKQNGQLSLSEFRQHRRDVSEAAEEEVAAIMAEFFPGAA